MSGPIVLALRLALALALLGFLGWALYTFWRNVRLEARGLVNRRASGISLAVRAADEAGEVRHFLQSEITLGRDPVCDIPIFEDTVSARHARLTYHHGQWWLEDLGSTNGTRLNQEMVTLPTVLTSGDEIGIGQTSLLVNLAAEALVSPTLRLGSDHD
ncbi:MAG: FHA domain-containing protein [Chloroflexota bacterium]